MPLTNHAGFSCRDDNFPIKDFMAVPGHQHPVPVHHTVVHPIVPVVVQHVVRSQGKTQHVHDQARQAHKHQHDPMDAVVARQIQITLQITVVVSFFQVLPASQQFKRRPYNGGVQGKRDDGHRQHVGFPMAFFIGYDVGQFHLSEWRHIETVRRHIETEWRNIKTSNETVSRNRFQPLQVKP